MREARDEWKGVEAPSLSAQGLQTRDGGRFQGEDVGLNGYGVVVADHTARLDREKSTQRQLAKRRCTDVDVLGTLIQKLNQRG